VKDDVLMVTRLDRLARLTRDLFNTLATTTDKKAGFRLLGDTWADITTPWQCYRPLGHKPAAYS
jgi:DNA invertase Pin-like site-specific DNA recombinase